MKNIIFILLALTFTTMIKAETNNPLLTKFNDSIPFNLISSKNIDDATNSVLEKSDAILNNIINVKSDRSFENTLLPLDEIYAIIEKAWSPAYLLANVSTDKSIRESGLAASEKISNYVTNLQLNESLYEAVKDYAKTKSAKKLTGYKALFLEETERGFKRSGFGKSKEIREKIKAIQKELTTLQIDFNKNIRDVNDFIIFKEEDVKGLPENYKKTRLQEDGTYKIDVTYPSYRPFLKLAESDSARKKLYILFKNRAKDNNLTVLANILKKRHELITLLGYDSYAEYVTEVRMTKKPKTVWKFEKDLQKKVTKKAEQDIAAMAELKSKRLNKTSSIIEGWESDYYENMLKKEKFQLDSEEVKQYFEFSNVTNGLFTIYQTLFDISFKEVTEASVWHKDVLMYEVFDNTTKTKIGSFYLDMFPRKNKYGHAAAFSLIGGKETKDGYQQPASVLVCNFPKPTKSQPSLLSHGEVETYFHEFGHLVHGVLTKSPLISYAGTSVKRDFVEAPSQMLENWVWEKESLKLFAKHYKTGEVIPDALIEKMIAAKNVNSGTKNLQQIYYGTLDFTLHDKFDPNGNKTTTDIVKQLQNEITLYPYLEGTHMEAAFGHLVGYAASYYGYLWAKVYAQDMFSIFSENGIMDKATGLRYRQSILEKGGTEEPMELVKTFLGRKPNNKAFITSLGLSN